MDTTNTGWKIDDTHSGIHFTVRHMVVTKVRGRFAKYSGSVALADGIDKSNVEVRIDAASIDTGVADRDAHLRSADFLDVATFPAITYRSRDVVRVVDDRLRVTGDLTIRDTTREVVLDVDYGGRAKDPWGNERAGFSTRVSIDRKDFGLKWNQVLEAGGVLVGDKIEVEIELQLVKSAATQAA